MSCSPHAISERRQNYCLFVNGNTCLLQQQLVKHTLNFWQSVQKRCREKGKKKTPAKIFALHVNVIKYQKQTLY